MVMRDSLAHPKIWREKYDSTREMHELIPEGGTKENLNILHNGRSKGHEL